MKIRNCVPDSAAPQHMISYNERESATTSRAEGMRKLPGRRRDDAMLVLADFLKNFDRAIG